MKMIIGIILTTMLFLNQHIPLESEKWLKENLSDVRTERKELLLNYLENDFTPVWLKNQTNILGFIGNSYQRFYIHFSEIIKRDSLAFNYIIKGKSKSKNNICDFNGKISVLHIREYNLKQRKDELSFAIENNIEELIKRANYKQFIVLSEFVLFEDSMQKFSGKFHGIMRSFAYLKDGKLYYDDLDWQVSDPYNNNQFVGEWMCYKTSLRKKCCWGSFRIPFSGDLDIGAGEFSPNEKYLANGWQIYSDAYFHEDKNTRNRSRKIEEKEWWK